MGLIKITPKHKAMAYLLNTEFGYSMKSIGKLMNVAQSTISSAIKDFRYELTIKNLYKELDDTRKELISLGYSPIEVVPSNFGEK